MEGTLLKWTNYYNGWQLRYFVLNEKGILSYYKSSELIHEGCKGSCLVLACELKTHPHDPLRFDLIIPGEQFFCLKAKSQLERQRWIVALGTCKSRGTISESTISSNFSSDPKTSQLVSHLSAINDELKLKVQELRLYETVLMENLHSIKSIVNETPTPDVKRLDEKTSMLSVTCDGFIQTLDQCVQLATGQSTRKYSSNVSLHGDQHISTNRSFATELPLINSSTTTNPLSKEMIYQTFLTQFHSKLSQWKSLTLKEISSNEFLSISEEFLHFFELLNRTQFAFLRTNINESISMLKTPLKTMPDKASTVFDLLTNEISSETNIEKKFPILFLQRIFRFLCKFLIEFGHGDKTIEESLNKAYGQTLKRFDQWNRRQLFAIAFQSAVSNEDFFRSLCVDSNHSHEVLFEQQVLNEMIQLGNDLNALIKKIDSFYSDHQFKSDEIHC